MLAVLKSLLFSNTPVVGYNDVSVPLTMRGTKRERDSAAFRGVGPSARAAIVHTQTRAMANVGLSRRCIVRSYPLRGLHSSTIEPGMVLALISRRVDVCAHPGIEDECPSVVGHRPGWKWDEPPLVARIDDAILHAMSERRPDLEDAPEVVTRTRTERKLQKPKLYKVLLQNDDYTTMEFVVFILQRVFHRNETDAVQIMLHVHKKGIGVAGVYSYEVAETRVAQVDALARQHEFPLRCSVEEA